VTDFGIARSLEAQGLTATGRVLGTTDYVSPEQALGHEVTGASDIYSLGVCLYEMLTGEVPFRADTQVAVAMKHVRDPMPDVQRARPEVSAALAAVVERATAKEVGNRYASADEMVHDLEQVLAIEAARAGATSGEATTVLRTLPGDTAEYAPRRLRRPRSAVMLSALAVGLIAGAIALFATRTEKGAGGSVTPKGSGLTEVKLSANAATDYDPESEDGEESPDATQNAIDGNRTTNWDTETYRAGLQGVHKAGVGLYVDAGSPLRARQLDLVTSTPGFVARVYAAANAVPTDISGWTAVSPPASMSEDDGITLDTRGRRFRYYLLWITDLKERPKAVIQELSLKK
jgi:eukaryotic-like serine/threonine-protein kinase